MTIMTAEEVRAAMSRRGRRPPSPTTRTATAAPDPRRILGLDLAMGTTGWALLNRGWPEAHGSFALPERRKDEQLSAWLMRRATEMARQLDVLLYAQAPEAVGYEYPDGPRPSWSGGSKGREFNAVQGLSRAEGMLVALWPTCGRGLPLVSVPASEMRRIVTGQVNANKDQIAWSLATYRRWDVSGWTADEIDAGGIALATPEVMG